MLHCIARSVGRRKLFRKPQDCAAFEPVMAHALDAVPVRLPAYCLMPNHGSTVFDPEAQTRRELAEVWHLLLWPKLDAQLGKFICPNG